MRDGGDQPECPGCGGLCSIPQGQLCQPCADDCKGTQMARQCTTARPARPYAGSNPTRHASQVEDPAGSVLYEKKDVTQGQFAFTTKEDGDFKACFTAKGRI